MCTPSFWTIIVVVGIGSPTVSLAQEPPWRTQALAAPSLAYPQKYRLHLERVVSVGSLWLAMASLSPAQSFTRLIHPVPKSPDWRRWNAGPAHAPERLRLAQRLDTWTLRIVQEAAHLTLERSAYDIAPLATRELGPLEREFYHDQTQIQKALEWLNILEDVEAQAPSELTLSTALDRSAERLAWSIDQVTDAIEVVPPHALSVDEKVFHYVTMGREMKRFYGPVASVRVLRRALHGRLTVLRQLGAMQPRAAIVGKIDILRELILRMWRRHSLFPIDQELEKPTGNYFDAASDLLEKTTDLNRPVSSEEAEARLWRAYHQAFVRASLAWIDLTQAEQAFYKRHPKITTIPKLMRSRSPYVFDDRFDEARRLQPGA